MAKDVDIQNLILQFLEELPIKYGDIYTEFNGQNEYFVNNIDHIVISESCSNNVVKKILKDLSVLNSVLDYGSVGTSGIKSMQE